jgi:hypothetical protein
MLWSRAPEERHPHEPMGTIRRSPSEGGLRRGVGGWIGEVLFRIEILVDIRLGGKVFVNIHVMVTQR